MTSIPVSQSLASLASPAAIAKILPKRMQDAPTPQPPPAALDYAGPATATADPAEALPAPPLRRRGGVMSWVRKGLGVLITVLIFVWILKPIVLHWGEIGHRILATNWWRVLAASALFACFLFIFRVLSWRRIVKDMGCPVPLAPATRIWSTSELARYLPGVIWQVVGRAYLAKPYGVSGRVCSTSQVMELAIFLLANLIMAVACLLFMGVKHVHGLARAWLVASGVLVPALICVLHPRVFYPAVNHILAKLKKPPLERELTFKRLLELLGWSLLGLAWQGIAIWLVVNRLLDLKFAKWWVVTGAYCLAWCAGFLAVWAPGGLGVREAVFIAAMEFAIPRAVRHGLGETEQRRLFLIFLSVLLRIWATVGELILAGIAYAFDMRGALHARDLMGRSPAAGRSGPLRVTPAPALSAPAARPAEGSP